MDFNTHSTHYRHTHLHQIARTCNTMLIHFASRTFYFSLNLMQLHSECIELNMLYYTQTVRFCSIHLCHYRTRNFHFILYVQKCCCCCRFFGFFFFCRSFALYGDRVPISTIIRMRVTTKTKSLSVDALYCRCAI